LLPTPATVKKASEVADDDMILDIGPETAALLAEQLKGRHHRLERPGGRVRVRPVRQWHQGHRPGDCRVPAFSIAGGGDTLAAIAKYGIEKDVGYISTGGGAFLEVLEGKTLPAFEILEKRANG
jgi:phosphoglycerate kinase